MTQTTYRPRFVVTARLESPDFSPDAQVLSLSQKNVCFLCNEAPGLGTEVEVVIHVPAVRSSISAFGRVVWRNKGVPADVAVSLESLDPDGRALLSRYLEQVYAVSTHVRETPTTRLAHGVPDRAATDGE
ncbi:MAG TPA: PilZ domain-containing protein [Pseudomonadota bacterium]|mgnify:CR=1 FL=1|nr:PilZ domain-containing protein [Pseudomonadota bacterium]